MSTQLLGKILTVAHEHNARRSQERAERERASRSIDLPEPGMGGAVNMGASGMDDNATGRQYLGVSRAEVGANRAADRDRIQRHNRRGDVPGAPGDKPFLAGVGVAETNQVSEDPIVIAVRTAIESEVKRVALEYERLCEILGLFNDVPGARRLLALLLESETGYPV